MRKRKLGKTGLEVSALGLGCMGLSYGYGPAVGRKDGIALIRAAVEHGVTFFDTAEVYGPFTNEELVGEALAPFREQVVIATKFGFDPDPDGRPRMGLTAGRSISGRWPRPRSSDSDRRHRSPLPAPRRPGRADRGCRGHREGSDPEGKVKHFGLSEAGVQTSVVPTPSSRSPRFRANIRCGGGSPRRRSCRRSRSSASALSPSALSARAS